MGVKGIVRMLGIINSIECSIIVLSLVTRDTMFLKKSSVSMVPFMTVISALVSAMASKASGDQIRRAPGRLKSLPSVMTVLASIVLFAFYYSQKVLDILTLYFGVHTSIILNAGLYIWIDTTVQLMTQHFWEICGIALDVRQSKQYFGQIAFGSTIGTLFTGTLLIPYFKSLEISTESNLIAIAAALLVVALFLLGLWKLFLNKSSLVSSRLADSPTATITTTTAPIEPSKESAVHKIKNNAYLRHICVFEMMATVVRVLVDFQTLQILSAHAEDEVKSTLGMINGLQSFLMIPLQMLSGKIFTRFGVMYGIATLPLATCIFGSVTFVSKDLLPLVASRGLYNGVTYAIFNTARELLWLPLTADDRALVKPFVNGSFRSASRILGAALSVVMNAYGAKTVYLVSPLVWVLGLIWLIDTMFARRFYAMEFYEALKRGHIDFTSPHVDILPNQIDLVSTVLKKGVASQIQFLLNILPPSNLNAFSAELQSLFFSKSASLALRLKLLRLHTTSLEMGYGGLFTTASLLKIARGEYDAAMTSTKLRLAAVRACGYVSDGEEKKLCILALRRLISMESVDDEETCKLDTTVAIALLRLTKWEEAIAHIRLQGMLHREDNDQVRANCLLVVGEDLPELIGNGYLVYLLHNPSVNITRAALKVCSFRRDKSNILISALLSNLNHGNVTIEALQQYDPSAVWNELIPLLQKSASLIFESNSNGIGRKKQYLTFRNGIRLLSTNMFPYYSAVDCVISLLENLVATTDTVGGEAGTLACLANHNNHWSLVALLEELVLTFTLLLKYEEVESPNADFIDRIMALLEIQLDWTFQMNAVFDILSRIRGIENDDNSIMLSYIRQICGTLNRVVLLLSSVFFPPTIKAELILEGAESQLDDVRGATQEVLESILPTSQKDRILFLFFPSSADSVEVSAVKSEISVAINTEMVLKLLKLWSRAKNESLAALSVQFALGIPNFNVFEDLSEDALQAHVENRPLVKQILYKSLKDDAITLPALNNICRTLDSNFSSDTLTRLEIAEAISHTKLFGYVDIMEVTAQISSKIVQKRLRIGEKVVEQSSLLDSIYIIAKGCIQLHINGRVIQELRTGDTIGEESIFENLTCSGVTPYSASVISPTCILLSVSRMFLVDLLEDSREFGRGLLEVIATKLKWATVELQCQTESNDTPPNHFLRTSSMRQLQMLKKMTEDRPDSPRTSAMKKAASKVRTDTLGLEHKSYRQLRKTMSDIKCEGEDSAKRFDNRMSMVKQMSASFPINAFRHFKDISERSLNILERCIFLKGSRMFRDLNDDQVAMVAQLAETKSFKAHEPIYFQDDPADFIYFIISGEVEVKFQDDHPANAQPVVYNTGELFGQSSFARSGMHIGTATTSAMTHLLIIPSSDLIDLALLYRPILRVVLSALSREVLEWIAKANVISNSPTPIVPTSQSSPDMSALRRRHRSSSQ